MRYDVDRGPRFNDPEPSLAYLCARAAAMVLGYGALVVLFYAGLYAIGLGLYRWFSGEWL